MRLVTIGTFAGMVQLTPKALRLYDRLGLLLPAAVDAESGYRFYDVGQAGRARLIAGLRRIGMPLSEVRVVCDLEPTDAAEAVAAYWRRVSTDTADRARLASSLVEQLRGRDAPMTDRTPTPNVHQDPDQDVDRDDRPDVDRDVDLVVASACDRGSVRDSNEDAVHAGAHLLAVADGVRGPGGGAASAAAVGALRALPTAVPAAELPSLLARAVTEVDRAVRGVATADERPFTTLTALLRRRSRLALLHVGDTRAYLLRGGELTQLTQDHSWVRAQVDRGELTPAQARAHPRRAVLLRALGAGAPPAEADLALRTALPGDRYLLCSDGLSAVLDRAVLVEVLAGSGTPADAVERFVGLAHGHGAPDNIGCVVADVVAAAA